MVSTTKLVENANSDYSRAISAHHNRELIYSIQQIRAVAAFIVVLTHVWGTLHATPHTITLDFREVNIGFTFAAGFLYHALAINKPFDAFLKAKVLNVFVPYLIISTPAVMMYVIGHKIHPNVDLSQFGKWQLTLYLYLTGLHLGPLWFVPMIMILYIVAPLFRMIDKFNLYYIVLPVSLVSSILVFHRPEFNEMPPLAALHYAPIFLIGMFCSRHRLKIDTIATYSWPFALIALVTLWPVCTWLDNHAQWPIKIIMLMCMHLLSIKTQAFRSVVIDTMAKYSFGIFFLHGYFVSFLRNAPRGSMNIDATLPNALLVSALICGICTLLIAAIRRIFGTKSRYLIGV